MVRLLQKLWDSRNRGVDTPRSPSQTLGRLRALTPPAHHKPGRPSCRLQLEPLEDRLTPSGLDFFPVADVAINPMPLPASALVAFDPYKNFNMPTAGTFVEQEHFTGFLTKEITIPAATAGTPGQMWTLDAFYSLSANVTENIQPPGPALAGSYNATFSLAGALTEVLIPPGPILQPPGPNLLPTWVTRATINEQGSVSGVLNMPSPTAPAVDMLTWNAQTGDMGTESPLQPPGPIIIPPGPVNFQANIISAGVVQIQDNSALSSPPSSTGSFWQQDQVTETLMPASPTTQPPGPTTINAVFNTWGSVTEKVLQPPGPTQIPLTPPGPTIFPEVDIGSTQYTDSLMETILMPDGSMQTLTQTSMDMGSFMNIVFPIPTCTSC